MGWIIGALQRVVFFMLLLLIALISLTWNVIALCLYPIFDETNGRRIGRAGIAYSYRLFWTAASATGIMRLDVTALDQLRDEPNGLIIAANHPSVMDGVLIASRLPRTCCIMKASLRRNVFLGAATKFARYIRNDLPLAMIKHAVADLRSGGQLIIFPEGTRTVVPGVNPFRPGMTLIAKLASVPVQTVFIETQSPYLTKGWPLWRMPLFPIVVRVRLGQRFAPEADHKALLRRLEHYFRENLAPGLPAMRKAG
ncbi:MAG: lysophospholipid acyltransferase family protein [Geminicoccaceae bacterium]